MTELISATRTKLEREVEELENDIDEADIAQSEEWFRIATDIKGIKERFVVAKSKKEELFGCKSFDTYCKSDRSRFNKAHSNRLIAAADIRKLLPKPDPSGSVSWSEGTIRPLKELKTDQAKRAAGQAALESVEKAKKKGKQLSLTKAVEQAVERAKNTKAEQKARQKAQDEAIESTRPVPNLKRLISYAHKHHAAMEMWPDEYWTDAEEEEPGIAVRAAEALEQLASFLRE